MYICAKFGAFIPICTIFPLSAGLYTVLGWRVMFSLCDAYFYTRSITKDTYILGIIKK
jgi:hypothetical protein